MSGRGILGASGKCTALAIVARLVLSICMATAASAAGVSRRTESRARSGPKVLKGSVAFSQLTPLSAEAGAQVKEIILSHLGTLAEQSKRSIVRLADGASILVNTEGKRYEAQVVGSLAAIRLGQGKPLALSRFSILTGEPWELRNAAVPGSTYVFLRGGRYGTIARDDPNAATRTSRAASDASTDRARQDAASGRGAKHLPICGKPLKTISGRVNPKAGAFLVLASFGKRTRKTYLARTEAMPRKVLDEWLAALARAGVVADRADLFANIPVKMGVLYTGRRFNSSLSRRYIKRLGSIPRQTLRSWLEALTKATGKPSDSWRNVLTLLAADRLYAGSDTYMPESASPVLSRLRNVGRKDVARWIKRMPGYRHIPEDAALSIALQVDSSEKVTPAPEAP